MNRRCDKCEAFYTLANECRRNAPKANMLMVQGQPQIITIFPITKPENWCMEYVPKSKLDDTN